MTAEEKKKSELEDAANFRRLMKLNEPERTYLIFGVIFAFLNGLIFPSIGFILGSFMDVLASPEASDFKDHADTYSL